MIHGQQSLSRLHKVHILLDITGLTPIIPLINSKILKLYSHIKRSKKVYEKYALKVWLLEKETEKPSEEGGMTA